MAAIVDSGPVSRSIDATGAGIYMNLVTGIYSNDVTLVSGWDINPFKQTFDGLAFYATIASSNLSAVVATGSVADALPPGSTIGPSSNFATGTVDGANFHGTATHNVGILFNNEITATLNDGYVQIQTTASNAFRATIVRWVYEDTGAPITIPGGVTFLDAQSRKVHGAAGTFDMPLSTVTTNPTTEPRRGPTLTLVLFFDKPIGSASLLVTEGTYGSMDAVTGSTEFVWNIHGVADQQYLTAAMKDIVGTDGSVGSDVTLRVGLLLGDVNRNRVVTVSDLSLVNAQLAQPVTTANYLRDVNTSGALTVSDKSITNNNRSHNLPAP
jgi:hypothetical protein